MLYSDPHISLALSMMITKRSLPLHYNACVLRLILAEGYQYVGLVGPMNVEHKPSARLDEKSSCSDYLLTFVIDWLSLSVMMSESQARHTCMGNAVQFS